MINLNKYPIGQKFITNNKCEATLLEHAEDYSLLRVIDGNHAYRFYYSNTGECCGFHEYNISKIKHFTIVDD